MKKEDRPIIGQEAICPDGLGRVKSFEIFADKVHRITVSTYIKNRDCAWATGNVTLVNPIKE